MQQQTEEGKRREQEAEEERRRALEEMQQLQRVEEEAGPSRWTASLDVDKCHDRMPSALVARLIEKGIESGKQVYLYL
eukprot:scaffold312214_cov21-Tisochrysis_lutea.AAC.3